MIQFKSSLDEGYTQCVNTYNTMTNDGTTFINQLGENIDSLTGNWIGTDATNHINALIAIHNETIDFVQGMVSALAGACEEIVQVQEARESNGASGAFVGSRISADITFTKKSDIADTEQYECKPEARVDHTNLTNLIESFKELSTKINSQGTELMENWLDGNGRANVQNMFDEFNSTSAKKITTMDDSAHALDTAITNLEGLMR